MIGVVIPVHNQAAYLGEALDSIAAQTLAPADVVVVDDGSTDGSGDVARARGIRTIRTERAGPGAARAAGVAMLDTPLLAFLDGDDRFTPHHHAMLHAALEQTGAAGACGMVTQFADPGSAAAERYVVDAEPRVARHAGTLLVRRDAYDAAGGFPLDATQHDAFELFLRLPRVVDVPELVLERRVHGANRSIVDRAEVHVQYLNTARAAILRARGSKGP